MLKATHVKTCPMRSTSLSTNLESSVNRPLHLAGPVGLAVVGTPGPGLALENRGLLLLLK